VLILIIWWKHQTILQKVIVGEGQLSVQCLTRSSVETSKFDLANGLRSAFELMGVKWNFGFLSGLDTKF
jgi:hypothetical protein